jgi:hypothetical protein
MANDPALSNAAVNAAVDAMAALLNAGKLRIYDGSKPATADTAVGAQNLLAELTFGNPAFGAAVAGVAAANAITSDAGADATGTASWFRAVTSGGAAVLDGEVGTSGSDLNLNAVAISAGAIVAVTSLTITLPKA